MNATEGMLTSIMDQMRIMADEQRKAREVDRAEMRAAIDELKRKIEAPILSVEDDMSGDDSREPERSDTLFAAPCRGKRAGKPDTADPLSKLKANKTSQAQAQLLLSSKSARLTHDDDGEVCSGYYRTLADNQIYEVPWPCDTVYRSDGKRAAYDTMVLQEFSQGYLHIIASSLPINKSTCASFDHIAYLCHILTDSMHTDWDLVLNSHRQILNMIEQGQ